MILLRCMSKVVKIIWIIIELRNILIMLGQKGNFEKSYINVPKVIIYSKKYWCFKNCKKLTMT